MEMDERSDIYGCQPVPVGHHKSFVPNEILEAAKTSSGQSVQAGIDESDLPIRSDRIHDLARAILQIDHQIAVMKHIVQKILFNHFPFITARHQEVFVAVTRVNVHDVPKNRLPADFHHGLGAKSGLLGQSGAETTCEYDNFHCRLYFSTCSPRSIRTNRRAPYAIW